MELPASSTGLPSTPGQKAPPATPIALTPGQIVSARVLEALGADTYLLALRGRTLVANSPTPLTPDTIVQLAVQAAEDPESPVPVKLLAAAARNDHAQPPNAATRVAAMIAELGLPPGPAAALTVAAFTRLGVPLADPRASGQAKPSQPLRSIVALVQAAIDTGLPVEKDVELTGQNTSEKAGVSTDTNDRAASSKLVTQTTDSPVNRATPRSASTPITGISPTTLSGASVDTPAMAKVIATAHTPTGAPVVNPPLATSVDPRQADGSPPRLSTAASPIVTKELPAGSSTAGGFPAGGLPALAIQTRLTLGAHGLVSFTPPSQTATTATKPASIPTAGMATTEPQTNAVQPTVTKLAPTTTVAHLGVPHVVPAPTAAPVASLGDRRSSVGLVDLSAPDHLPVDEKTTAAEKTTAGEKTTLAAPTTELASKESKAALSGKAQPPLRHSASDRSPQQSPAVPLAEAPPMAETYGPRLARALKPGVVVTVPHAPADESSPSHQRGAPSRSGEFSKGSASTLDLRAPNAKLSGSTPIPLPNADAPRRAALASPVTMLVGSSAAGSSAASSSTPAPTSAQSSSGLARLAATTTPSELATAGARLARVSLPVTPATLALALRAPSEQPAAIAKWVPAALAQAIDPAIASPTTAMRAALQLAGVVPAGLANDPAQTLLQHLIRIAVGVGSAGPLPALSSPLTAPAETLAATSAGTASHNELPTSTSAAARDEAREPDIGNPQTTDESPRATGPSPTADPALAAVRDVAAEHLLPPTHLDDYERVIPLPMMHAGQPVPARLAVTTRRTASGGTACWMRVDCALSSLGSVSVRLSGADGGPVAVSLIAAPAAAAVLAQALPALTHDLHAKGVVAALRVVAHDGDPTEIT